jgi:hypothetical protein
LNDNPEPECAFSCVNSAGQTITWKKFYYGSLPWDLRNVFVAAFTLDEPFFKNMTGVASGFLKGWQVSGITRAQSGQPLTVNGSTTVGNLTNENFTDRANLVAGQPLNTGMNVRGVSSCGAAVGTGTKVCYFNTSAFTSTGMTTGIGNAPVGDIIGPGYYIWDLSLRKSFRLPREGMSLLFQLDAFNAFNHVNFQNPALSVTTPSSFGTITAAQPPRQLQLGAKFNF